MAADKDSISRQDFNKWRAALKQRVEDVYKTDEAWFAQLRNEFDQFENDNDAKSKVAILENLDEALKYSFDSSPIPPVETNLDEALSELLIEVEGYKRLSDRYFSKLLKMSETDRDFKRNALTARTNLLDELERVQQQLREKEVGITLPTSDLCTDLFLARLKNPDALNFTQQLFNNRSLELSDAELKSLITAWGEVVSGFITDAQDIDHPSKTNDGVNFGESATIADFLCIHDRLDTLYGRLATNVTRE